MAAGNFSAIFGFYNKMLTKSFYLNFDGRITGLTVIPKPGKSEKNTIFLFQIKFSILVLFLIKSSIFTPLLKTF